jgi:hypothetical protein
MLQIPYKIMATALVGTAILLGVALLIAVPIGLFM